MVSGRNRLLNFETQWRRKDGGAVTCRIHVRVARKKDGTVEHFEGAVEDITKEKRISERLQESEARYRSIFDCIE